MDIFDTLNKRNENRVALKRQVKTLLQTHPEMRGDKTTLVVQEMFYRIYGFNLTEDQIKFIGTVDRLRRLVQKENGSLDHRAYTKDVLEPNDRKFYGGNKNEDN